MICSGSEDCVGQNVDRASNGFCRIFVQFEPTRDATVTNLIEEGEGRKILPCTQNVTRQVLTILVVL